MKVLVIGGMHGNEPLGIALVEKIKLNPIEHVDAVIANEIAVLKNVRFDKQDLNRVFPGAPKGDYETTRAAELVSLAKDYDYVLDFHNTYCPDNDCTFVGLKGKPTLYALSESLGLTKVIVADYDCINKFVTNCLSVEISLTSNLNSVEMWYEKIKQLVDDSPPKSYSKLVKYEFVYRMTLEDVRRFNLDELQLKAFVPLKSEIAHTLGFTQPVYPIFIADKFTPYNYGGLLIKKV